MFRGGSYYLGMTFAQYIRENAERKQLEKVELIRQLNAEEQLLSAWLENAANQQLHYFQDVNRAKAMLDTVIITQESNPSLDDVQNKLADFKALKIAVTKNDATDLLVRARNYLSHNSPLMIG